MSLDEAELMAVAAALTRRVAPIAVPVATMLEQARSPEHWRQFAPQLSVEGDSVRELTSPGFTVESAAAAAADARGRGYFHLNGVLSPEVTGAMRQAVERLATAGWPVVFSFVFDEFWSIARTAPALAILHRILGDDCVQLEGIWTHCLLPTRGSHGWEPHTDATEDATNPGRLSFWFPLSDATLENGCIYVIPKDLVPERLAREFLSVESFSLADTKHLLQSALALPAAAGAMMGWDSKVIHWGSTCHGAATPRISVAIEFASREYAARRPGTQTFELRGPLPSLDVRLELIAKGILSYTRFEPLLVPFEPLARQLIAGARG